MDSALISKNLYPFEGNFLDIDGLRYHYLDEGQGGPVVMLHGNPTWSFYYRDLIKALCGSLRAVAPDHIGCGLSEKPDDSRYEYTLRRREEDLETLLEHLDIRGDVTLVLHDWGGMIGMLYAVRHPGRIKRLVILNTSAFHLPETKRFPWALWLCRNTALGAFLVRGFNAFSTVASHVCCTRRKMPREIRRAYREPYDSWQNRIATLRFVQDIPLKPGDAAYCLVSEVEQNLAKLAGKPMLICWGMKDFVFDDHFLRSWEEHFPNAEIHRFEDCGHYILEDASEEVIEHICKFIERT